jgi:hypothetical protein
LGGAPGAAGAAALRPGELTTAELDEFPDPDDFPGGSIVPPLAKKMCPYAPREEPLNGLRPLTNCTRASRGTSHTAADPNRDEFSSWCDRPSREPPSRFPPADAVDTTATVNTTAVIPASTSR